MHPLRWEPLPDFHVLPLHRMAYIALLKPQNILTLQVHACTAKRHSCNVMAFYKAPRSHMQ